MVSGSATDAFDEAIALGLDAFLTGELAEHVKADARASGVHFIAGGHYGTEVVGIRRLGELVSERFGVEHRVRGRSQSDLAERPTQNVKSACAVLASRYPEYYVLVKPRGGTNCMAIHLTPTELGREAGMHRREVIAKCMELGVPIFQGRIDKTLFSTSLKEAGQKKQLASA
jgi:hypothetical protein